MHKAYDRVEWNYLERIMLKLGFHRQWVNLIMACVTSVSYNVRFNEMETESFVPTREYVKVTPCPLIYFCWWLKAYPVC